MDRFINFNLLKNPLNWLVVFLMIAIALFGADLFKRLIAQKGTEQNG